MEEYAQRVGLDYLRQDESTQVPGKRERRRHSLRRLLEAGKKAPAAFRQRIIGSEFKKLLQQGRRLGRLTKLNVEHGEIEQRIYGP